MNCFRGSTASSFRALLALGTFERSTGKSDPSAVITLVTRWKVRCSLEDPLVRIVSVSEIETGKLSFGLQGVAASPQHARCVDIDDGKRKKRRKIVN